MIYAGIFLRQRPTAATTIIERAYCHVWLNTKGDVICIEWLP
jgi:hypothetical protein